MFSFCLVLPCVFLQGDTGLLGPKGNKGDLGQDVSTDSNTLYMHLFSNIKVDVKAIVIMNSEINY